jgi:hypothetical protein
LVTGIPLVNSYNDRDILYTRLTTCLRLCLVRYVQLVHSTCLLCSIRLRYRIGGVSRSVRPCIYIIYIIQPGRRPILSCHRVWDKQAAAAYLDLGVKMGCFHVSPSPAAFSVAQSVASFRPDPVVRRRAHSLCSPSPPRLQMLRPAETPRPRLAIRAQNHVGDGDGDPFPASANSNLYLSRGKKPHNFPKEGRHISSHLSKLIRVFDGLLVS